MTTPSSDAEPTGPVEVPPGFRSGFIGVVGKPNVGKSTLVNALVGQKISIVSPRPQTTRQRILGILTRPDAQAIFIDSPGWHEPTHPLGRYLVGVAQGVLEEADVVVMVLDAASGIRKEDQWLLDELKRTKRRAVLALNKVDKVNKRLLLPLLERCAAMELFEAYVPVSALTGLQVPELLNELISRLPEGPCWYERDTLTDQSTKQVIRELIREQVLMKTHQEVPHSVAVLIEDMQEEEKRLVIHATVIVEREGQKAIIIGQKGSMMKRVGTEARKEIERLVGRPVFLQLWAKVIPGWRSDPTLLRELGYEQGTA